MDPLICPQRRSRLRTSGGAARSAGRAFPPQAQAALKDVETWRVERWPHLAALHAALRRRLVPEVTGVEPFWATAPSPSGAPSPTESEAPPAPSPPPSAASAVPTGMEVDEEAQDNTKMCDYCGVARLQRDQMYTCLSMAKMSVSAAAAAGPFCEAKGSPPWPPPRTALAFGCPPCPRGAAEPQSLLPGAMMLPPGRPKVGHFAFDRSGAARASRGS